MGQIAQTSVLSHSTGLTPGVFLFALLLLAYLAALVWMIGGREDEIDRDIKDALDYSRRQSETARAINGDAK